MIVATIASTKKELSISLYFPLVILPRLCLESCCLRRRRFETIPLQPEKMALRYDHHQDNFEVDRTMPRCSRVAKFTIGEVAFGSPRNGKLFCWRMPHLGH